MSNVPCCWGCKNCQLTLPSFCRTFSGFACNETDSHWTKTLGQLTGWAEREGVQLEPGHVRACYDLPTKLCGRRNEVWLVKAKSDVN